MSAYELFANDHRQQVLQQQPQLRIAELARELAARWKASEPRQKAVYELRAAEQKAEYLAARARYHQQTWVDRSHRKKRKRWGRNLDSRSEGEDENEEEEQDEEEEEE